MTAVSVVITTYNRVQFLQRAIQSVLRAGSELELVVVRTKRKTNYEKKLKKKIHSRSC